MRLIDSQHNGGETDPGRRGDGEALGFSVVIPTFNRPRQLAGCLAALSQQEHPRDRYEVLVVDDGTPPSVGVVGVVDSFRSALNVRIIVQHRAGPAAARNRGARQASLEYLAFTDDDCRPRPGWLKAYSLRFRSTGVRTAGGNTVNAVHRNYLSDASQLLVQYITEYYGRKGEPFFASNNLVVERALFMELGGFDTRFPLAGGEDRDFSHRCTLDGHPPVYVEDALIDHHHALTWRSFMKQHFNYGRGAATFHEIRRQRSGCGHRIEPVKFYADLVRYPHAVPDTVGRPGLVSLSLILAQAANATGYF